MPASNINQDSPIVERAHDGRHAPCLPADALADIKVMVNLRMDEAAYLRRDFLLDTAIAPDGSATHGTPYRHRRALEHYSTRRLLSD